MARCHGQIPFRKHYPLHILFVRDFNKKKYVEIKIRYEIKIHLQYMQIGRRTVFGTE